jgi:hypothetical protein
MGRHAGAHAGAADRRRARGAAEPSARSCLAPTAAAGDLRLDTEILRLQQDFTSQPSRVRFTLRAYVVDNTTRRVLASRVFDESVAAATDDPYGGILAANRAVQRIHCFLLSRFSAGTGCRVPSHRQCAIPCRCGCRGSMPGPEPPVMAGNSPG